MTWYFGQITKKCKKNQKNHITMQLRKKYRSTGNGYVIMVTEYWSNSATGRLSNQHVILIMQLLHSRSYLMQFPLVNGERGRRSLQFIAKWILGPHLKQAIAFFPTQTVTVPRVERNWPIWNERERETW